MKKITSSDLYAIAMESDTAYRHMPEICKALGMQFPPTLKQPSTAKREALPDPFPKGEPAPVTLAIQ